MVRKAFLFRGSREGLLENGVLSIEMVVKEHQAEGIANVKHTSEKVSGRQPRPQNFGRSAEQEGYLDQRAS